MRSDRDLRELGAELAGNCDAQSHSRAGVHHSIADGFSALAAVSQEALQHATFRLATAESASINGIPL